MNKTVPAGGTQIFSLHLLLCRQNAFPSQKPFCHTRSKLLQLKGYEMFNRFNGTDKSQEQTDWETVYTQHSTG